MADWLAGVKTTISAVKTATRAVRHVDTTVQREVPSSWAAFKRRCRDWADVHVAPWKDRVLRRTSPVVHPAYQKVVRTKNEVAGKMEARQRARDLDPENLKKKLKGDFTHAAANRPTLFPTGRPLKPLTPREPVVFTPPPKAVPPTNRQETARQLLAKPTPTPAPTPAPTKRK